MYMFIYSIMSQIILFSAIVSGCMDLIDCLLVICFRFLLRPYPNSFSKDWVGFAAVLTAQVGL